MAMDSSCLTTLLSSSPSLLLSKAPNRHHTLFFIPADIASLRRCTSPPHLCSSKWPKLLEDHPGKGGEKIAHPTFLPFSAQPKRKRTNSTSASDTSVANVSSRHVIVTGGNSGIGKATATALAKQGMSITIACRSKAKGEIAVTEISQVTGNPSIRAMVCDLASFKSIRNFVREYEDQRLPLHVLVNNAGIMACPQLYTDDGFEMQFGVNHLGHFLLTALLLDTLNRSASSGPSSRVVILASAAEQIGHLDFSDLNFKVSRGYNPWVAYGQSKLANCLFSYELSRRSRVAGLQVSSNCMHPGIVDTQLIRYILPQFMLEKSVIPEIRSFLLKLLGLKSPEEGALTTVHLASSNEVEHISGCYFDNCQVSRPSLRAQDGRLAAKLWKASEELTETSALFQKLGLSENSVASET